MTPGWSPGGTAMSTTSIAGSSSISFERLVDPGQRPQFRHFARLVDRSRRDPHHAEAGLGVSHQVAVADDEARAHDADAHVPPLGQERTMVQVGGLDRTHWGLDQHRGL